MKTGRPDLDAMIRVASIPSDEPTFLLRAQDDQAANAVRAWAQLQLAAGAPVAIVEQALKQADAMDAWPVKKQPGADHLSDAAQRRMEYEFRRREWNGGDLSATALAQARGEMAMLEHCQPLVNFVGYLATMRDPGADAEAAAGALAMIVTSIREVGRLLIQRAAEHGIIADSDGFGPVQDAAE